MKVVALWGTQGYPFNMEHEFPIDVMDGICALCCFGARMIHRLDRSGDIRIVTIQTVQGQALLAQNGLDTVDPDSWLFIKGGQVWHDFDAMIRVGERSGGVGRLLSLLRLVPKPMRQWIYNNIARNRYRMFGRADMCALPNPALRARLLP